MCDSTAIEAGTVKPCVREFPETHFEHISEDGLEWNTASFPINRSRH